MTHTINNEKEAENFFEEFNGPKIKTMFFGDILVRSKDLKNKILLFQSEKRKYLIHFNHAPNRFENRKDLKSIFLLYGNRLEGDVSIRGFIENGYILNDLEEFLKEEEGQEFSNYVMSEIQSHISRMDRNYEEKLLALGSEELYDYLENNETDINYIRKIFEGDQKVYASVLVNKMINDEKMFLSNTRNEELYDRVIRGFLKRSGIKSFDEIDFEHFIYRYLLLIKDSKYTVSEIRKIIKLSNELTDESLEDIFKKLNNEKLESEFNHVKKNANHYWKRIQYKIGD